MSKYIQSKKFLSYIRQGDYAHAGEEKAIVLALEGIPKDPTRKILDVGCGLGGTAHYIQTQGWGEVTGIDIEGEAIDYAKKTYSNLRFFQSDILDAHKVLEKEKFDLFVIFNAFFSFPDQAQTLKTLAQHANPQAKLIIFDYSVNDNVIPENPFTGGNTTYFSPLQKETIHDLLTENNWELENYIDISHHLQKWYTELVERMEKLKPQAIDLFTENDFNRMYTNFSKALELSKQKRLGACIIKAKINLAIHR